MAKRKRKQVRKGGRRYPLLLYTQLANSLILPGLILAVVSFVLWFLSPTIPMLGVTPLWMAQLNFPLLRITGDLLLLVTIASMGLLCFGLLGRLLSYAQCHFSYLLISTPIYRVRVPYKLINTVTLGRFAELYPMKQQSWSQRSYLEGVIRALPPEDEGSAVQVRLRKFPANERLLRLLLNRYMFIPKMLGFLLIMPNWMTFTNELTQHMDDYRGYLMSRKQDRSVSLYSRMKQG